MAIATRRKDGRGKGVDGMKERAIRGPVSDVAVGLDGWRAALRADMAREMADPRWPRALVAVGVVHLCACLVCHVLATPIARKDLRFLVIWFVELVAVLAVMRACAGRRWFDRSEAVKVAVKLWSTFLILSFNVVSLNSVVGIHPPWFKPVWGTLSTFFFASLAWLFSPLFFIPATMMWATGLFMAMFDLYAYVAYGVSWLLILCGVAANLRRAGGRLA